MTSRLHLHPVHTAIVPDEPPVGSVVLDNDGIAWQRIGSRDPYPNWQATHQDPGSFNGGNMSYWSKLLVDKGPLTELHRPDGPKNEAEKLDRARLPEALRKAGQ